MREGAVGVLIGLGCCALLALPAFAAGHGRPGLWNITTTVGMPRMPQMSADQAAQMKAAGVNMTGANTFTVQHCVTPQEAALDKPPMAQSHQDCTMNNYKLSKGTMTADMVCTGATHAKGKLKVTFDSDRHYAGVVDITAVQDGQEIHLANRFEGKWVSASCGSVAH